VRLNQAEPARPNEPADLQFKYGKIAVSAPELFRRWKLKPLYANWWLVSHRRRKVTGILESDEQGHLTLALNGLLTGGQKNKNAEPMLAGQHRLAGATSVGTGATLEGCFVRYTDTLAEPPRQVWHVGQAVLGVLFDAKEPWKFAEIREQLPLLTEFARLNNVDVDVDRDDQHQVRALRVTAGLRSIDLWDYRGIRVSLGNNVGYRDSEEGVMEVESRVDLCAKAGKRSAPTMFTNAALRPMQLLIGLATGRHTSPVGSTVVLTRQRTHESNSYPLHFTPLDLTAPQKHLTFAFYLADIQKLGADARDAWLRRIDLISPVIDLYLAALRELGYAELSFGVVVQALETYHRRTTSDTVIDATRWQGIADALSAHLVTAVPESSAQSIFVNRLDYLNELSLRQRLKDLINSLGRVGGEICGGKLGRFVDQVTTTRNYFTHWDSRNEQNAVRGGELVYLTSRLIALLEVHLLRDLGFALDSGACTEVLRRRVHWLPR
jgi:hypothetical protein